jgi:hypothetical protein
VLRRHLDDRLRIAHAAHEFMCDLALGDVERRGQPLATAGDGGHHLVLLDAGALEMGRLRRRFDHRAQVGERHRLVMNLDLTDLASLRTKLRSRNFSMIHLDAGLDRLWMHELRALQDEDEQRRAYRLGNGAR